MNIILMKPFGHVGIATATSVAAFVSLYQYLHGLKKRGFWEISASLKKSILDIFICTAITGIVLIITEAGLNYLLPVKHIGWLFVKLSVIGIIGLATFLIAAKIKKVMDITAIIKAVLSRRKRA